MLDLGNFVGAADVDAFERTLHGELIRPDSADYEQHRAVWNGSIQRRPALIARCVDAADVTAALGFACDHDLLVAVRGGGHSFPGYSTCDSGLVVDLSPMKGVEIDPERRVGRVQAGVLIGELDAAAQRHGLVVPAGVVTHTGVAGLTLGGGIGWLHRRFGLTIDQLLSATVVLANGEVVRTSAQDHADLFFGLRGGGGNFGVVTEFEFRLHRLGPVVLAGPIFWPIAESPRLLRFYRDWIAEAPDELMTMVVHRRAPALPFVPIELHGRLIVGVVCCYSGAVDDGERFLRPLRRFASPVLDLCRPKPFVDHQAMFDPSFPHGWWYYMRACDVDALTDEVIDITAEYANRIRSPLTTFPIWQMGGAIGRLDEDETAFSGRGAKFAFNITAATATSDGFDDERDWVRSFWTALTPHHRSVYVNFLMDEGENRIRQAYGAEKYQRLQALKKMYDPTNLLQLNQNIPPT
jgi:hypothetical protein